MNSWIKSKDAPEIVNRFKNNLAKDGALIIIEPGDNISCKALKNVRNAVVGENGFNLYSPCIGIWEEKSSYNCSCFNMVRSFWEIPKIYQYLVGKGLTKASRIDVPFNYVVLRLDDLRKYDISTNYQHYTKVSDLPTRKYLPVPRSLIYPPWGLNMPNVLMIVSSHRLLAKA